MSTGKVRPSRVEEAPLVAAVEMAPVRLTKAAAERVVDVMVHAIVDVVDAEASVACRCENCEGNRVRVVARVAEALVAEMRLAGWRVIPPGAAGGQELRGGV